MSAGGGNGCISLLGYRVNGKLRTRGMFVLDTGGFPRLHSKVGDRSVRRRAGLFFMTYSHDLRGLCLMGTGPGRGRRRGI